MSTPTNTAAYLTATKSPLEIRPAPYPTPADDEVIIKTHAIAFNPVDWAIQTYGPSVFKFITLPAILGYDVAGTVTATGASVTNFHPGDRVAGLAHAGGLQYHVPLLEHLTIKLPPTLPMAEAAVLPMGVSVATKMLFHRELLALAPPTLPKPPSRGETVLIWGGSTSVGSCAIQLAVAAGYDVVTTASPHNFEYVRALGAGRVFDYASATVRADVLGEFEDKVCAGAVANSGAIMDGDGAVVVEICAAVVKRFAVGRRVVAMTMVPSWGPVCEGVECRFVEPLRGDVELAAKVLHDYVPAALAEGAFRAMPRAEAVGQGLEAAQGAMDLLKQGVSAKKIVVTI